MSECWGFAKAPVVMMANLGRFEVVGELEFVVVD